MLRFAAALALRITKDSGRSFFPLLPVERERIAGGIINTFVGEVLKIGGRFSSDKQSRNTVAAPVICTGGTPATRTIDRQLTDRKTADQHRRREGHFAHVWRSSAK